MNSQFNQEGKAKDMAKRKTLPKDFQEMSFEKSDEEFIL